MTRLANVTKFPHATGEARMGNQVYITLRFRGCTSTTTVICEIWEEE